VKVYLAGPLGFSEAGRAFHTGTLIPALANLGCEVLDPWTLTDPAKIAVVQKLPYGEQKRDAWRRLNVEIGGNNRAAIDRCDLVFAVLDGVDVDSGTAAEIGYAFAKGKPILGYRGDFRLSADNEGSIVNLQVEYFIRQSGGDIITAVAELPDAIAKIATAARIR
jgi:nucleoside 2-deoxyribosyltransferase